MFRGCSVLLGKKIISLMRFKQNCIKRVWQRYLKPTGRWWDHNSLLSHPQMCSLQPITSPLTPQPSSINHYSPSDHKSALYPNKPPAHLWDNHEPDPRVNTRPWPEEVWEHCRGCIPDLWPVTFEAGSYWLCPAGIKIDPSPAGNTGA